MLLAFEVFRYESAYRYIVTDMILHKDNIVYYLEIKRQYRFII